MIKLTLKNSSSATAQIFSRGLTPLAMRYSTENKMVYLTENGCLFDPELARRDGAMWGMWCTWSGEFVARDTSLFQLSEQYTEESMLKKVYEDEDVITLEDLPDLKTYKIRKGL